MKTLILLIALMLPSIAWSQDPSKIPSSSQYHQQILREIGGLKRNLSNFSVADTTGAWEREQLAKQRKQIAQILKELKEVKALLKEIKAKQDSSVISIPRTIHVQDTTYLSFKRNSN